LKKHAPLGKRSAGGTVIVMCIQTYADALTLDLCAEPLEAEGTSFANDVFR
jgi:hypothetical protein